MRAAALLVLAALLAGCMASTEGPAAPAPPSAEAPRALAFTGAISGSFGAPATQEFAFDVPAGAAGVGASLAWTDPGANVLGLALVDPSGATLDGAFREAAGRLALATVEPPAPGAWTARVTSSRAADASFTLDVVVDASPVASRSLADDVALRPGEFAEVNLVLEAGATLGYAFRVSGGNVTWDLHSHDGSEVAVHAEGAREAGGDRAFEAPARGVYSLYFVPEDGATGVWFSVTGPFRVHSRSR